jgi:isoleucyl-tRNA synthetase
MIPYYGFSHWLVFQTPLKELLVFHSDLKYLADVKPLERYILSELNVRDIIFTSDESLSGVKYRAVADWSVLGKKLRKDLRRVRDALPNVSSDDVKAYVETGKIMVAGIELVTGDLTVQRWLELPPMSEGQYGTHTDNDVVVRLDIQVHPELLSEGLAREFINRVQKLRKKAGLQATDDIDVFYHFEEGTGEDILAALTEYADVIAKTVRNVPVDVKERREGTSLVIEEEQDIGDVKFMLTLVRP